MRELPQTNEHRRATRSAMGLPARLVKRRRLRPYAWPLVLALVILALIPLRARLDKAHITLSLLLVVLIAAADGGRVMGLITAGFAFLGFNWFFLPPYGTFIIADPLDWFVLFAFFGTSVVASHLFHQVQLEADAARERTGEVVTLATLGAEAMTAPRADEALSIVAQTARDALGAAACHVHVLREGDAGTLAPIDSFRASDERESSTSELPDVVDSHIEPVRLAIDRGARVAVLDGGVVRVMPPGDSSLIAALGGDSALRLLIPLRGGKRTIGVLDVEDAQGVPLNEARERMLVALAYYAALGAERARNERSTERLEALREADRMRTAILASVSHDLRTPLTTIKALAHEMRALGDERSEVIEQEADRLNRFVADMLDMSRLASGRVALIPTIVPLDELVSVALQQVEGMFGARQIVVQLPDDDAFPLARMDLTHSVRILVNLLENARKYAPGESPILVTVSREGAMMCIAVSDRGPGVPPEESERIFEALYRPASTRPDVGSSGLGLAIARGLAEAQGGTLVLTPRPGGGSTFTLRLPAAELSEIDNLAPRHA